MLEPVDKTQSCYSQSEPSKPRLEGAVEPIRSGVLSDVSARHLRGWLNRLAHELLRNTVHTQHVLALNQVDGGAVRLILLQPFHIGNDDLHLHD